MTTLDNEILLPKFYCSFCDYKTAKKSSFKSHNESKRHKNNASTTADNAKIMLDKNKKIYKCEKCEKLFNDRAGLWRHNKKDCIENNKENNKENNNKNNDSSELNENIINNLLHHLIKENNEIKTFMMQQQNTIIENQHMVLEICKNGTHNTNNSNNSNNKTFNLEQRVFYIPTSLVLIYSFII